MTNITLLHLSDIHAQNNLNLESISALIERESIELIVISGDITQFGTKDDIQRILALFNQLSAVVFYVTGNLDPPNSFTFTSKNVKPLEGQLKEFKGVQFVGLSGSNKTLFRTPYELTEEEIQMKLQHLKTLLDTSKPFILVSHVPPFNSGADTVRLGKPVGSSSVRDFVLKEAPLAVCTGHIHESKVITTLGKSLVINPGPARHQQAALLKIHDSATNDFSVNAKLLKF